MKQIQRIEKRKFLPLIATVGLVSTVLPASTHAALVTLEFTGTVNTYGNTVFGLSGPAVPYDVQIQYDTALNTNTFHFAKGADLGGYTTTDDWYGYSKSGVVFTDLTFGNETWTAADLAPRLPAIGVSADLWFNTDIAAATPTTSWLFFSDVDSTLQLGGAVSFTNTVVMESTSEIHDASYEAQGNMTIASVPEPVTTSASLFGFFVMVASSRRRLRGKR